MKKLLPLIPLACLLVLTACGHYDVIIKNGTVYDGSGSPGQQLDIAINGDRIVKMAKNIGGSAELEIDAAGMAVAPGFINNLSWAYWPLLEDGRSMSNIKQGVTLEVFGEGTSPGPYNPEKSNLAQLTFGENMRYLEEKGVSCNIASYVGATTIRRYVIGEDDRSPTGPELSLMQELVHQSMREGALGLGTSLIYPPAFFAKTDELIALSQAASGHGGLYISHMRSEGDRLLEAVDELITIAQKADIPAEIYHLKAAGSRNWPKLEAVLQKIDSANRAGLTITTNMYNYMGASTGLDACLPPWSQDGGKIQLLQRLRNPVIREQIIQEMQQEETDWENFLQLAGQPENILLLGFDQDSLNYLIGKNLGEVAAERGISPAETICDLIVANNGDISTAYFLMSEENVKRQLQLPYMTFGSDARSIAAEGQNLESMTHPRTYGNFARLLGKYVREEKVIPMEEAIHKLSGLAAEKIHLKERGFLKEGFFADVVIFDPATITDRATFKEPHQYAEGVVHVLVNGTQVLANGEHTGEKPGRFVRGPGFQPAN